jgi:hypothetical protein
MDEKLPNKLAAVLRKAITDSPLNLNAIAKGAGVVQPALWSFMNEKEGKGKSELSLRNADKLAAFFGLELRTKKRKRGE